MGAGLVRGTRRRKGIHRTSGCPESVVLFKRGFHGEAARQSETGKTIRPCAYKGFLPVHEMADAYRKGITDAAGIDFR